MTTVINLLGGPGAGKSTIAAATFAKMKMAEVNCELVTEYAKDVTWEGSLRKLENQIYVFGHQYHRLWRVAGQVDAIITDSPLFLILFYGSNESQYFKDLVLETFNRYDNMTYFVRRKKAYNPVGRNQTEAEAIQIDEKVQKLLDNYDIDYDMIDGDLSAPERILREYQWRMSDI